MNNDYLANIAENEMKNGKTKILNNQKDIDRYLDSIISKH